MNMDDKTLNTLEYFKILDRLAAYCAFAGSRDKALALRPSDNLPEARRLQSETSEAIRLLTTRPDLTIGGVRDVRAAIDLANHGGVLFPADLLDVKSTLVAARTLARTFERLESQYPLLSDLALRMPQPPGLVDAITRALSDRGEILDSASDKLANIRRDLRIAYDRLMTKLQRLIGDPKNTPYLQESLITQRDGRYVVPLRAEFKGRIKSIVHDQSASGATLFIEPLNVVEHNNQYRELQLAERDEERRILAELSAQVGQHSAELQMVVEICAELDLIFARAKYADDLRATEPVLLAFDKPSGDRRPAGAEASNSRRHPGSVIRLYQARHPLLDPATVVAIDVDLDPQTYALVITGPNTGGKTVALKTVGLLALMAQSGLHIPAHSGSEISVFRNVFADIGDEQSIEQSLSTFSGHITNIIRIMDQADRRSLVILDELGAGTDPQEGAALARAILSHLLERGMTTLVTTHHPELKAYAHATPGVVNASVEFDLATLRPTYHLTIGLPGRSNALAIAQRLGMPGSIIAEARKEISPDDQRAESLLDEIHRQRDAARKARGAADWAKHEAEKLRAELVKRLDKIEDERRAVLEKARAEAEAKLQTLEAELLEARRQLARARQPLDVVEAVAEKVEALQVDVEQSVERSQTAVESALLPERSPAIAVGSKVRLKTLNMQGVVTTLDDEEAEVQVGVLRVRAQLADLESTVEEKPQVASGPAVSQRPPAAVESPGLELDVRGQRAEEALDALERYLDSAYLAGLLWARIIHGKGTGKLRQAVRECLSHHPNVKSFEAGGDKEGGEGVTVVKLAAG
jgi:DNA mismatch repair protein MutS2